MATVLFADEEVLRMGPFVDTLRDAGHTVIVATDASNAVTLAEKHAEDIDVVVMDIMMPGGEDAPADLDPRRAGLWGIGEIRKIEKLKNIPVIMLSAVSQRRVDARQDELKWVEYLEKPVDLDEFIGVVAKYAR